MSESFSWQDYLSYKKVQEEEIIENFDEIKLSPETMEIKYPEYKEAFDYVDTLFPWIKVKEISVYFCPKKVLENAGYSKIGGIYCTYSKTVVVVSDLKEKKGEGLWGQIRARTTVDETLVHELLHYASDMRVKGRRVNIAYEEEFAYGYSIPYFLKKGWTEETIIDNYFMPHLVNMLDKEKIKKDILSRHGFNWFSFSWISGKQQKKVLKNVEKELYDETINRAREAGKKIFNTYKDKKPGIEPEDDEFGFMVL